VPWRIRYPLIVLAWTYGIIFVLAFALYAAIRLAAGRHAPYDPELMNRLLVESPAVEMWALVQGLLILILLIRQVFRRWHVSPDTWFKPQRFRADAREAIRLYFMALVLSAFVVFTMAALIQALMGWFGHADPAAVVQHYLDGLAEESDLLLSGQMSWLRVVVLVLLVPPIEELLFRGCLYPALRKRLSPWPANLTSSAIFAISHHYSFGLPNILVIGILGAYAYERTRSLWAPILFHILWNLGAAASAQSALWAVVIPLLIGLGIWSWSGAGASSGKQRIEGRRIGWKVYAILYGLLSVLDILSDPSSAWMSLAEVPLWFGLFAYAWRKPTAKPGFWRVYGVLFLAWFALTWWVATIQPELRSGWQNLLAGPGSESVTTIEDLILSVISIALVMSPALVVLLRLAKRPAPVSTQTI
jgi:membrane protease YdiL (CAAX protease family)